MATFTVTTDKDVLDAGDGKLSLREAVRQANATTAADTIEFATSLTGKTITLAGSQLTLKQDLTIDGGTGVVLDAGERSRLLLVEGDETDVVLEKVTLTSGYVENGNGGAIYCSGRSILLDDCTVSNSSVSSYASSQGGGGIFVATGSNLMITHSIIENCSAASYGRSGGGIFLAPNSQLSVSHSVFSSNSVRGYATGGAIYAGGSIYGYGDQRIVISDSQFLDNGGGLETSGEDIYTRSSRSPILVDNCDFRGQGRDQFTFPTGLSVSNAIISNSTFTNFTWAISGSGMNLLTLQ